MVVRVDVLAGERRDHLVRVHVRGGARAGLEDVDRELVVELAGGDPVGRGGDALGESASSRPSSAFTRAAAALIRPSQRTTGTGSARRRRESSRRPSRSRRPRALRRRVAHGSSLDGVDVARRSDRPLADPAAGRLGQRVDGAQPDTRTAGTRRGRCGGVGSGAYVRPHRSPRHSSRSASDAPCFVRRGRARTRCRPLERVMPSRWSTSAGPSRRGSGRSRCSRRSRPRPSRP